MDEETLVKGIAVVVIGGFIQCQTNCFHLFCEPSLCLAQLQMDLCRAANIFAAC